MPRPLAPHHYLDERPTRRLISPGTVVQLIRTTVMLAIVAVVAGVVWWGYGLRQYPQVRTLETARGKAIHAYILGRGDDLIEYAEAANGDAYYVPIAKLSLWDQAVARLMPVNLTIDYPLNCSLTDQDGKNIHVRIEGRTDAVVKFTLLSNGQSYVYPFSKLSATDREWITALPASDDPLESTPAVDANDPVYSQQIQDRIAELTQDIREKTALSLEPANSQSQRQIYFDQINEDKKELLFLKKKVATVQPAAAK